MRPARVIALGQAAAGDDAIGLRVLDALRTRDLPPEIELRAASNETDLVTLLDTRLPCLLVDAVLGQPVGDVIDIAPDALATAPSALSTHGIGVAQALELARVLSTAGLPPLRIVGIKIAPPAAPHSGLSPAVADAIPRATEQVLRILGANA